MTERNSGEIDMEDHESDDSDEGNESDENCAMDVTEESADKGKTRNVYLPGDPLKEGEVLTCDESAYVMLHEAQTGSPCLSFDIIKNPFVETNGNFPMTAYMVAGTQAPQTHANSIIVMKMGNLHATQAFSDDDSNSDSDDESNEDEESKVPVLQSVLINHLGCVNRIRSMVHENVVLTASWSELGRVNLWNITDYLKETEEKYTSQKKDNPLFSFKGHGTQGYSLDWNPLKKGLLASGDCKHGIHIWHPAGVTWQVDQRPLVGHTASVEDLQWSPNEENVLASCSVDKSIRIWDVRSGPHKANKLTVENAHEMDVNVISWNRNEPFLLSGGDDGILHVWDLRNLKTGSVASFKHHTQPVTTVEWHPDDGSVFASGGQDHQIALWDLAVERDTQDNSDEIEELPSQLLFIHQGQTEIKELHWHPQYPGVVISTALNGFNIFKTISV